MLSKEEIKKLQEKLKTDKKFAKEWEEKQLKMMKQVKKELFG